MDFVSTQIEASGIGTASTVTQATVTNPGRETGINPTTAIKITTVIGVPMETRTAAQEVTATTARLGKGPTTSTATTGTRGLIDPITRGKLQGNQGPLNLTQESLHSSLHSQVVQAARKTGLVGAAPFHYVALPNMFFCAPKSQR